MSAPTPVRGKQALLAALLLLLLLPALQARFHVVRVKELGGYAGKAAPAAPPALDWAGLKTNAYQDSLEHYLEGRVGFRPWLIRLRNQFSYSVLGVARANHVLVGRDRVLYEERPIRAYLGEDFVGEATVDHRVRRFRAVQDTLARHGTLLVFVVAPSKASFMPEYLPEYFRRQRPRRSNYQAYAAALRRHGVNLLDLSQAFRQWKDTAAHPLFPRGGIHYSSYGAKLVGDTLLRYLERRSGRDLRDYRLLPGDVSRRPRDTDNDIAAAMNLLWAPTAYPMAYPVVKFRPLKPGQRRPSLLLIGDSFCWPIVYPFVNKAFAGKSSRFWYYNSEVAWPEQRPEGHVVAALNRKQAYLSHDIIVVLFTEYNLNNLDSGFSDDAYNLFTPYTRADTVRMQALEQELRKAPHLADRWWKKSTETGMTVDQLVHQQALARYDSIRH